MSTLLKDMNNIDAMLPQMLAQFPPIIAVAKSMQGTLLTLHSSFSGLVTQMSRMTDTASAMGQAFDSSKADDYFYLPPEAFDNPDFQRGLKLFLSPDGKAARFIITHDADPATPTGISAVKPELNAAHDAVKGTPLANAKFYLTGTAAVYNDIQTGSNSTSDRGNSRADTDIRCHVDHHASSGCFDGDCRNGATVAGRCIRAVRIGLATHFGPGLNWIAPVFGLIIFGGGSDYNLLLVSRFQEEIRRGTQDRHHPLDGRNRAVWSRPRVVFASP